MNLDQCYIYGIAALIVAVGLSQVFRRGFDPFAPIWLFLAGYAQIYVFQPISYREYGLHARGLDLVTAASFRALWALLWFLAVYYCGLGKLIARRLPGAPVRWSPGLVGAMSPVMIVWGLACSGVALVFGDSTSAVVELLKQFPIFMLVGGVLLLVTGRQPDRPRPTWTIAGLGVVAFYCLVWMFNGKRSHSMFAILAGTCAFYVPRFRRPSLPILGAVGIACALVVSLALGWRGNSKYEQSFAGFFEYVGDFNPRQVLVNLNLAERSDVDPEVGEQPSKETEEWGGFLLMMDTVPHRSEYDYGASYLRLVSTYIPRQIFWENKPLFGRDQWIHAWQAGSEQPRADNFTGPAIGILGAAQLNGGAIGTALVMAVVALVIRTAYDYYRYHAHRPWAQVWWSMTYYNSWLMIANDDPSVWFYYLYGHTILPPMLFLWLANRVGRGAAVRHDEPAFVGSTGPAAWGGLGT